MFSFKDLVLGNADFANLKITKYFGNLSCSDLFAGYFSVYVFCLVIIHIFKFLCTVDKLILSSHKAICHFLLVVSHSNIYVFWWLQFLMLHPQSLNLIYLFVYQA